MKTASIKVRQKELLKLIKKAKYVFVHSNCFDSYVKIVKNDLIETLQKQFHAGKVDIIIYATLRGSIIYID